MHPSTHARTHPGKPACVMASRGETLSYDALDKASNRGAHLFRRLGLKRGDVAAILLENCIALFEIAWAAQRAGLYLTSISTKLTAPDIGYILRDCDAKILIASDTLRTPAADALATCPALPAFLLEGESGPFRSWTKETTGLPDSPIADETPGTDMLYSSGTTGRPKGVKPPLPEGPLDAPNFLTDMGQKLYGMDGSTLYLSTSPLYHAAPLRWAMTVQRLGGTVVIMEQFDAEETLALIARHRITHTTLVPTHFIRMLKLPEAVRARYDVSSLRAAIHAAAPCPVPVKQAMIDWWGPLIFEYYSGTEACGVTALSTPEWLAKPGSVGRAVVGTVRITDEAGNALPRGADGLVCFEGGPKFEYHKDPAKTAEAYNEHGWATLGDIGHLDDEGYLFLTDRKSFMIISGGVNIYPQEIENLLVTHPKVADAAVIGAPDEEMGERIVAVIQPVDWAEAGPALARELEKFCRQALGGVKCPRRFDFRKDLPRQPTGKLFKRALRDEYWRATGGS